MMVRKMGEALSVVLHFTISNALVVKLQHYLAQWPSSIHIYSDSLDIRAIDPLSLVI
jgi:hypothetical protein